MICRSRSIHLYSGFRRHTLSRSRAGACRAISESHHAIMWRESGDRFVAVERSSLRIECRHARYTRRGRVNRIGVG